MKKTLNILMILTLLIVNTFNNTQKVNALDLDNKSNMFSLDLIEDICEAICINTAAHKIFDLSSEDEI